MDVKWLIEETVKSGQGVYSADKALIVRTGQHTGRAAKNRYILNRPEMQHLIDWGSVNVPMDLNVGTDLIRHTISYLEKTKTYQMSGFVGGFPVEVISTSPWHIAFAKNMFREKPIKALADVAPKGKIIKIWHLPHQTTHDLGLTGLEKTTILIDPWDWQVIIVGTAYAGEIKKSAFSIANFIFPQLGFFPMHASANCLKDGSESCVLFGLSGTGKTTLSAAHDRFLIGDDEIVWTPTGISNIEGGCYAKLIGLTEEKEPEIFRASNRLGSILENVVFDEKTHIVNFHDASITENTRSSYPLTHLEKVADQTRECEAPGNIIFLSADAFGALPAVAKLNSYQAQYHFLSGYTSKLAGTEIGVKEPVATFSTCFGAPFMPLKPSTYASLLAKYMESAKCTVWLLNTGWTGKGYGHGERFPLKISREIVRQIQSGELMTAKTQIHPIFGFEVPIAADKIDAKFLQIPEGEQVLNLARKFMENIKKFSNLDPKVVELGGPRLPKTIGSSQHKAAYV